MTHFNVNNDNSHVYNQTHKKYNHVLTHDNTRRNICPCHTKPLGILFYSRKTYLLANAAITWQKKWYLCLLFVTMHSFWHSDAHNPLEMIDAASLPALKHFFAHVLRTYSYVRHKYTLLYLGTHEIS